MGNGRVQVSLRIINDLCLHEVLEVTAPAVAAATAEDRHVHFVGFDIGLLGRVVKSLRTGLRSHEFRIRHGKGESHEHHIPFLRSDSRGQNGLLLLLRNGFPDAGRGHDYGRRKYIE